MSRQSNRYLWRHVERPPDWCRGCGYHPVVNGGAHRADCTAQAVATCRRCGTALEQPRSVQLGLCEECRLTRAQQRSESCPCGAPLTRPVERAYGVCDGCRVDAHEPIDEPSDDDSDEWDDEYDAVEWG